MYNCYKIAFCSLNFAEITYLPVTKSRQNALNSVHFRYLKIFWYFVYTSITEWKQVENGQVGAARKTQITKRDYHQKTACFGSKIDQIRRLEVGNSTILEQWRQNRAVIRGWKLPKNLIRGACFNQMLCHVRATMASFQCVQFCFLVRYFYSKMVFITTIFWRVIRIETASGILGNSIMTQPNMFLLWGWIWDFVWEKVYVFVL